MGAERRTERSARPASLKRLRPLEGEVHRATKKLEVVPLALDSAASDGANLPGPRDPIRILGHG